MKPNYTQPEIWDTIWKRPYKNYEKHHQLFWQRIRGVSTGFICDLACGSASCWKQQKIDGRLVGVDFSSEACYEASKNCPNATFICEDVVHTSLESHVFDTVVLCGLVNYYRDLTEIKNEAARLVKLGGKIIITINVINDFPDRTWDEKRIHEEFDGLGDVTVEFYPNIGFFIAIEIV